jgi:hypothetical protein
VPPRHGDIALVMELVEGDDLLTVMLNWRESINKK